MAAALNPKIREALRDGLFCLSLANMFFLKTWSEVQASFAIPAYFKNRPNVAYLAIILNVVLLGVVFWLGLFLVRQLGKRWLACGGQIVFGLVVLLVLNSERQLANWPPLTVGHLVKNPLFWLLVVGIGWWHKPVMRVARGLVLILTPLILITFCQTLRHLEYGVKVRPLNGDSNHAALAYGTVKHPRVVWLLFDEMDQRIAFANRPLSIQLPEFDRFRSQSVSFENAYPAGANTEVSIPALLSGVVVTRATGGGSGCLLLSLRGGGGPTNWASLPSIFSRARDMGLTTAVAGWLHPYPRLFPYARRAFWEPFPTYDMLESKRLPVVMLSQYENLLSLSTWEERYFRRFVHVFENTLACCRDLVAEPGFDFVFCHFSIPHLPGIRDRSLRPLVKPLANEAEQYLSNLLSADWTLGELRRGMERAGVWDRGTVVITSDHWLRGTTTNYLGEINYRVPLLVKMPEQSQPVTYSMPVNNLLLHDLSLAILQGHIHAAADCVAWIETNRARIPVDAYVHSLPQEGRTARRLSE